MWLPQRLLVALAGASLLATLPISAQHAKNAVVGVRFWSLNDITRVAIETTDDFEFRSDRLPNPDRLFFDLVDARLRIGSKGQQTIPVADRLLKQIRVAESRPGTTRVVFDLESDVEFSASQLSNPTRLIVELRSTAGRPQAPNPVTLSTSGSQSLSGSPEEIAGKDSAALITKASMPDLKITTAVVPPPKATLPGTEIVTVAPRPTPESKPLLAEPKPTLLPPPKVTAKAERVPQGPPNGLEKIAAPKPARLPKNGAQSLTRVLGLKVGRVVLDAGHGGHDTGTSGPTGLLEKDLVLDITKRLGALIESRMGSEVIYTRSDDVFVPLETRTQLANDHKADLFLSIHANSSPYRASSGVETYYLNFTTLKSALEVAARENASSEKTVYELKDLLQKIALKDKVEESKEFAARIQTSLFSLSARSNPRVHDRGIKKAPFVVLIGASMPSVLAEIGFISNTRDEALMRKPEYRQKIAEALYKGLSNYASSLSHFQVALKN
jgi:N-acetylmuramoyl-L-alanine amidase